MAPPDRGCPLGYPGATEASLGPRAESSALGPFSFGPFFLRRFLRLFLRRSAAILLALAAFALLGAAVFCGAQEPGVFKGRRIAGVMTYQGAPWLERADRESEENPAALLAALPLRPGATVADLGCGSGYYARRLAALVGPSGHVRCVDIQAEMLEIAARLATEARITNIENVLSTPTDPRLGAGTLDLILLVDVYHELQRPEPMLEAMRQALTPSGVVALVEFRLEGDSASHIKTEHRMSKDQVLAEWLPAGFELAELIETLPTQHLFLFRRR